VRALDAERKKRGLSFLISIDGGIDARTGLLALEAGADILVTGSSFFTLDGVDKRRAYIASFKKEKT
jgi:ribulose-phosphate 3-epimerase